MSLRDHDNLSSDEDSETFQYPETRPEIRALSLEKDDQRVSSFAHYSRGVWILTEVVLSVGPTVF